MGTIDPTSSSVSPTPTTTGTTSTTGTTTTSTTAATTSSIQDSITDLATKLGTVVASLPPGEVATQTQNVMNQVIELLMDITQSTQRLGVATANSLTYQTNMQGALNSMINAVPVFDIQANGQALANGSTTQSDQISAVNNANQEMQVISSKLNSYLTMSQNDAKQIQSGISNINDAQQTYNDLLTSIWNTMKQLLATLFQTGGG